MPRLTSKSGELEWRTRSNGKKTSGLEKDSQEFGLGQGGHQPLLSQLRGRYTEPPRVTCPRKQFSVTQRGSRTEAFPVTSNSVTETIRGSCCSVNIFNTKSGREWGRGQATRYSPGFPTLRPRGVGTRGQAVLLNGGSGKGRTRET